MHSPNRDMRRRWISAVTLLLAVPSAGALRAAGSPARVEASSYRLEISPQVDHDGATLSVSGPDHFYLRQQFAAGDPIALLPELDGATLADGQYAWEITFAPRIAAATRAALSRARDTGDEETLRALIAAINREEGAPLAAAA